MTTPSNGPLAPQPEQASSLAMDPISLQEATLDDFLPPIDPWVRAGGWILLGGMGAAVVGMGLWPYHVVVRGIGQVRPAVETSVVNAPHAGMVRSITVALNERVRRGQQLAVLDPEPLQVQRQALSQGLQGLQAQRHALALQGTAAVAGAEQEVNKANAALRLASTEARRYQQLLSSGAGSRQQMEEKQAARSVAQANLAQARRAVLEQQSHQAVEQAQLERQLSAALAEQRQVDHDLRKTEIRSPVDGVVLNMALRNPGQMVAQGQELARIAPSNDALVARVLVPGEEIAGLRQGQRADLKVSGCPFPDFGTLPARVQAVAPDAEGGGGYAVTLVPDRTELQAAGRTCRLQQGMELQAAIITKQETVLTFLLRRGRLWLGR